MALTLTILSAVEDRGPVLSTSAAWGRKCRGKFRALSLWAGFA